MNFKAQKGKELELIAAILGGNTELYHQLVCPYARSIYIISFSCMKDEKAAEDVTQETFIRAFRNLRTFQGYSDFSAWLMSIALNEAKKRLQRQKNIQITFSDEPRSEETPVFPVPLCGWHRFSSDVMEHEKIRKLLQQSVMMLPDICQQVLLLRDVEKLNVYDTARLLNINPTQVNVILHRARMTLQRLLAPKLRTISNTSL
jgi:RNA polymerase sigma-70 factor, ECF subfamily